jgi:hypothetical protein
MDMFKVELGVFLGIFILLYLKILWKLKSFNWLNKSRGES